MLVGGKVQSEILRSAALRMTAGRDQSPITNRRSPIANVGRRKSPERDSSLRCAQNDSRAGSIANHQSPITNHQCWSAERSRARFFAPLRCAQNDSRAGSIASRRYACEDCKPCRIGRDVQVEIKEAVHQQATASNGGAQANPASS